MPYFIDAPPDLHSLAGPAIELVFLNGENSGRDQVAEVFFLLFPFKRRFISQTSAMASSLGSTHFNSVTSDRADSTVHRGRGWVDYATPSHYEGIGTLEGHLRPGGDPIAGAARLAPSNGVDSVVLVNVRLPSRLRALAPVILDTAGEVQPAGR